MIARSIEKGRLRIERMRAGRYTVYQRKGNRHYYTEAGVIERDKHGWKISGPAISIGRGPYRTFRSALFDFEMHCS